MDNREIIYEILNIIKNTNDIIELKKYVESIDIPLEYLTVFENNYYWYNTLQDCIENKISLDIVEYLHLHGKYDILSSAFLSVAISKNNFEVANYIIDQGGEDVNFISYNNLFSKSGIKSYQYLLNKGLSITRELLNNLIEVNNYIFLDLVLRNYIYNDEFILLLLSYYKNKNEFSYSQWNELIEKEKEKSYFDKKMYEKAINKNSIDSLIILYNYDIREKNVIIQDFYNIFNESKNIKGPLINKLKNTEFKISADQEFIIQLEKILTKQEIKDNIYLLIKNNNKNEFHNYLQQNNIKLSEFLENFDKKDDIVKFAIKNNVSIKMINFICKECQYDISNLHFDNSHKEYDTFIFSIISKNQFEIFEFLFKNGIEINNNDVLIWLYEDQLLDNKKLKYILNNKFAITTNTINQLIADNQINILKKIFKYFIFNDIFILKLLSIYKNKTGLTSTQLTDMIIKEKDKIKFDISMYKKAIDCNNYEAISFLYSNDNRKNELILNEIFQIYDKDERIFRNGKKNQFICKVKNGQLKFHIDNFFLDNLNHSEERNKILVEKVKANDISDLRKYILDNNLDFSYFNNNQFDLLILAIESEISFHMIKFIMEYYTSFDYTINSNGTQDYKSPLSCALSNQNYSVSKLLLKKGANIKYKINGKDILDKLYQEKKLNKKILILLLNHGLNVSPEFLKVLIKNKNNGLLQVIMKYSIFNNAFILNLLSIYCHRIPVSRNQLKRILIQEESKIDIGEKDWFKNMISNKNLDVFKMFYHYRCCEREEKFILDQDEIESLMNYSIETNDYNLMNKIFNSPSFDPDNFNIEKIIFYHHTFQNNFYNKMYGHYDIVKYLVERTFSRETYNLKNIQFYKKLGDVELNMRNVLNFFKFFINEWINHKNFSFKNFDFEKILSSFSFNGIAKLNIEEKTIELMKYFVEISLKHKSFDFHNISFENILNRFKYRAQIYRSKFDNKIEHLILLKLVIDLCMSHETFDFKNVDFEEVLTILYHLNSTNTKYDVEAATDLMKFTIEKSVRHKTFDVDYINIKKDILLLILQKDHVPIIKCFIKEIFNNKSFSINNKYLMEDIVLTISRIENLELIEFLIEIFFQNKSINIKDILAMAFKIKNQEIFQFIIKKLFQHQSLVFNDILEDILLVISKNNKISYLEFIMEQILHHERFNKKILNNSLFNINKILKSAIRYDNDYFISWIFKELMNFEDIKSTHFENLLLYASKIDNAKIMKLFLELLINICPLEKVTNIDNIIIDNIDDMYLSLILNILIKLCNLNLVQYLVSRSLVNTNVKDKNGDFPLIISYYTVSKGNNSRALEIFDFLLDHDTNINVKDINNTPLLLLALENKSYTILQHIFKHNIPIKIIDIQSNSSSLIKAINENNIEKVKLLLQSKSNCIDHYQEESLNNDNNKVKYLTPLTLAYLLNYKEIFKLLMIYSNINILDYYGYSILHYALFKEDKDITKDLVLNGINVNFKKNNNNKGHSALEIVINLKNRELFQILLSSNNLSFKNLKNNKESLLITIINMKNYTIEEKLKWMEDLTNHGADVNVYDKKGQSIFSYAFKKKSLSLIKFLMEHGAYINNAYNKIHSKISIIKYALGHEDIDTIEYMFKYNKRNSINDDDLIDILKNASFDMIQRLIPRYIDINRKDNCGNSLLFHVLNHRNDDEIVKYLMENGIDFHGSEERIKNRIMFGEKLSILKLMIPKYIDVNSDFGNGDDNSDGQPNTILNYAISNRIVPFIQYIIQCQPDFTTIQNKIGFLDGIIENNKLSSNILQYIVINPSLNEILKIIVENNRKDLLNILIKHNLDINKQYKDGKTLLIYAIDYRNVDLIHYFIENHAKKDNLENIILKEIITDGKLDVLKYLLISNSNIKFKEKYGHLTFQLDKSSENKQIQNRLEKYGDINITSVNNIIEIKDTILTKSSLDLLKQLITDNNNCMQKINYQNSLIYAIQVQNKDIINYLVESKINVKEIKDLKLDIELFKHIINLQIPDLLTIIFNNFLEIDQKDQRGDTMLTYAVPFVDETMINYLIQNNADINMKNNAGDVPLSLAIQHRKINIIQCLINSGADKNFLNSLNESLYDINKKYNYNKEYMQIYNQIKELLDDSVKKEEGNLALKFALITQNEFILKYLFDNNKININIINDDIKIVKSIIDSNNLNILKYLIEHQLNINAKDNQGNTTLVYAIYTENEFLVKYLMEHGATTSAINKTIESELFIKILNLSEKDNLKQFDLLKIIYCNSINGNQNDNNFDPILCHAIRYGNIQLVKYLIDNGADVNSFSRSYENPFILAIKSQKEEIVKCLVKAGANVKKGNSDNPPLIEAVHTNNETIIKYLLECGADVNERGVNVYGDSSLTAAIKNNNETIVKLLIDLGANINKESGFNETPLILAVRNQNQNIIKLLIEYGADINYKLEFNNTPLIEALEEGNESIAKYLIDKGANVNVTNQNEETPLVIAVKNGMERIIKYLINCGADINYESHTDPLTEATKLNNMNLVKYLIDNGADVKKNNQPLTWSIRHRNEDLVKYLVYSGAIINNLGDEYEIPLVTAVNNNNENIVKFLIRNGADINLGGSNQYDNTPLTRAVNTNNENITRCLIEFGADINKGGRYGEIPLNYAIANENENIVRFLVDNGADINKEGENDLPLFKAIRMNNEGIVRYLVDHGADINRSNYRGETALILAIDKKNENIIRYLIHCGADIHFVGTNNGTPLLHAIKSNMIELVKYLIEHGSNVNQTIQNNENSPIALAALLGNEEIIKCLVEHGANVNGNSNEVTPLYNAISKGNENIVSFLIDHGANINLVKRKTGTPLISAIQSEKEKIIHFLVDRGADVNKCDLNGDSPLIHAINLTNQNSKNSFDDENEDENDYEDGIVFERKKERIVQYLIKQGADINKVGHSGSPIMKAIEIGNINIINYLINSGVDVNHYDIEYECSPLSWAIKMKNEIVIKCLIKCGANVNRPYIDGITPLMYAIDMFVKTSDEDYEDIYDYGFSYINIRKKEYERKELQKKEDIVKYLIECGADVNDIDLNGGTALIHAINTEDSNIKIVKYLIDHKADINKKDKFGYTALHYAKKGGKDILVKYIIDRSTNYN